MTERDFVIYTSINGAVTAEKFASYYKCSIEKAEKMLENMVSNGDAITYNRLGMKFYNNKTRGSKWN